jgi:hypothetical protein
MMSHLSAQSRSNAGINQAFELGFMERVS